jgi:hypothetical protein
MLVALSATFAGARKNTVTPIGQLGEWAVAVDSASMRLK